MSSACGMYASVSKRKSEHGLLLACDGVRQTMSFDHTCLCFNVHHVLTSATELHVDEVPGYLESHSDTQLLAAAQSCSLAHQLRQSMTTLHVMFDLDPPLKFAHKSALLRLAVTTSYVDFVSC